VNPSLLIEDDPVGRRALFISQPLDEQVIRTLGARIEGVTSIRGVWHGTPGDLMLLRQFGSLRSLNIKSHSHESLDAINSLSNLASLAIDSASTFDVDLANWPILTDLFFVHSGRFVNQSLAPNLAILRIVSWRETSLEGLSDLRSIEKLSLRGGALKNLKGLERMPKLQYLELASLRNLVDFSELSDAKGLHTLIIDSCNKLNSIDVLDGLIDLETLILDNVGDLASLNVLRRLPRLKATRFAESTNVLDGNTAILKDLAIEFGFQNRKHYNFKYDHMSGKEIGS